MFTHLLYERLHGIFINKIDYSNIKRSEGDPCFYLFCFNLFVLKNGRSLSIFNKPMQVTSSGLTPELIKYGWMADLCQHLIGGAGRCALLFLYLKKVKGVCSPCTCRQKDDFRVKGENKDEYFRRSPCIPCFW